MSLPQTTTGYALGPDDGEAMWFNGGLGILKATAEQTEGCFAAYELRIPKGFTAPLHSHKSEDEFFIQALGQYGAMCSAGRDRIVADGVASAPHFGSRRESWET
jgi:hypothetical protein